MNGWIKLHKSLKDWGWRSDSNTFAVFINLLIEANFKENTWKGQKIHPGQVIFGRKAFSKKTGISEQSIRTALTHLKSTSEITIKTNNKYSLISINNWEKYQSTNQLPNQQLTSNQPATNHTIRSKEVKKVRSIYSSIKNLTDKDLKEIAEKYNVPITYVNFQLDKMQNWCEAKGKKYKNYKSALCNWVSKGAEERITNAKQSNNKRAVDLSNL